MITGHNEADSSVVDVDMTSLLLLTIYDEVFMDFGSCFLAHCLPHAGFCYVKFELMTSHCVPDISSFFRSHGHGSTFSSPGSLIRVIFLILLDLRIPLHVQIYPIIT